MNVKKIVTFILCVFFVLPVHAVMVNNETYNEIFKELKIEAQKAGNDEVSLSDFVGYDYSSIVKDLFSQNPKWVCRVEVVQSEVRSECLKKAFNDGVYDEKKDSGLLVKLIMDKNKKEAIALIQAGFNINDSKNITDQDEEVFKNFEEEDGTITALNAAVAVKDYSLAKNFINGKLDGFDVMPAKVTEVSFNNCEGEVLKLTLFDHWIKNAPEKKKAEYKIEGHEYYHPDAKKDGKSIKQNKELELFELLKYAVGGYGEEPVKELLEKGMRANEECIKLANQAAKNAKNGADRAKIESLAMDLLNSAPEEVKNNHKAKNQNGKTVVVPDVEEYKAEIERQKTHLKWREEEDKKIEAEKAAKIKKEKIAQPQREKSLPALRRQYHDFKEIPKSSQLATNEQQGTKQINEADHEELHNDNQTRKNEANQPKHDDSSNSEPTSSWLSLKNTLIGATIIGGVAATFCLVKWLHTKWKMRTARLA